MLSLLDIISEAGDQFLNPITLVDMEREDEPLIYVNRRFSIITGYIPEEIIGQNCRFLQGPNTASEAVQVIRDRLQRTEAIWQDLVNYRKDRTPFINRLVLLPILYSGHRYFIGMQHDVTHLYPSKHQAQVKIPLNPDCLGHHLLNPLAAIIGTYELARLSGQPVDTSPLVEHWQRISDYVLSL